MNRLLRLVSVALGALRGPGPVHMGPHGALPLGGRVDRCARGSGAPGPQDGGLPGPPRRSSGESLHRALHDDGSPARPVAPSDLRQPAQRRRSAHQPPPRDAGGRPAALRAAGLGLVLRAARDPRDGGLEGACIHRRRAPAQGLQALSRGHPALREAHALGGGGEGRGPSGAHGGRRLHDPRLVQQRGAALADREALER